MRYGIFSDVHANLEALEAVIEAYKKENIDIYLCAGDIVGYAANPRECLEKTAHLAKVIVAGNHDFGCAGLFDLAYFNPFAEEAIRWTQGQLNESQKIYLASLKLVYQENNLALVHGSLFEPEKFHYLLDSNLARDSFNLQKTPVCFIGHSHVSGAFIKDNNHIYYTAENIILIEPDKHYIINVGSVGQPRDGNPKACFAIYDEEKKCVWIKRVDYDIKKTQEKIRQAALPEFLADRLSIGQ